MPARLVVHPAEGPVLELTLAEDREHLVGRDAACSVAIDDDRVSRRHARLTPLGGGRWQVADLGSKNGLTIDGRPVARAEIAGAAWLGFGGLLARFDPAGAPSPEAAIADELRRRRDAARLERRLDPAEGLEPLLDRLLASVLTVAGAERGFVVLARRDGGFEVAATAGQGLDEIAGGVTAHGLRRGGSGGGAAVPGGTMEPAAAGDGFSGSVAAVEQAIAERRPVVLSDATADTVFGGRPSVVAGGIRALVSLPLVALDRVLGAVYADSRQPGHTFTRLDVDILEGLAAHAALALAVVQLRREVAGLDEALPGAAAPSARSAEPTLAGSAAAAGPRGAAR